MEPHDFAPSSPLEPAAPAGHRLGALLPRERRQLSAEDQMLVMRADNRSEGAWESQGKQKARKKIPQGGQDLGRIQGPLIPRSEVLARSAESWGAAN